MEKGVTERAKIVAVDNKCQITAVFTGSLTGHFLPHQFIYKGTTQQCLPTVKFPLDWRIKCSPYYWSNKTTMKAYIEKILLPYVSKKRKELNLQAEHPALVIFNKITGQGMAALQQLL